MPGYESITWFGLIAPRGMPKAVVARWQSVMANAVQSRVMKERFEADGLDSPELGPAHFGRVMKRDIEKWTQVVRAANLKLAN